MMPTEPSPLSRADLTGGEGQKPVVVVTGATGRVGSELLPRLARDANLVLVGRQRSSLEIDGKPMEIVDYSDLAGRDLSNAIILHLAVLNNDQSDDDAAFRATNIDFLLETARIARSRGARTFINLNSTHAFAARPDAYGRSKQQGAAALREQWPDGAINLYVPSIYGARTYGRLAALNKLPTFFRGPTLAALKLIAPAISIDQLHRAIVTCIAASLDPDDRWSGEFYAADPEPQHGMAATIRRANDVILALAIAIVAWPVMVLIAILVRMDSPGPALFVQRRVGKDGRVFTCYKFRTMAVGTPQQATHAVAASTITRLGRRLRSTKLDELPQILNILRNEMAFVGPRPCLPSQDELVARRGARNVLSVKPGITGLAQVNDIDMSDPAKLAAWDDRYCTFRTVMLDYKLLLRTALGGGAGDRVAQPAASGV